ncbi:hypothetical protein JTE90_016401, partial [Oedothorax gibbosus]
MSPPTSMYLRLILHSVLWKFMTCQVEMETTKNIHHRVEMMDKGRFLLALHGIGYIITYEKVRHSLGVYTSIRDGRVKGLIGGGCGSLVSQTLITPFDVVSQHMMVIGQLKDKSSGNGATTR